MAATKNDNIDARFPKPLDNRIGIWTGSAWRYYTSLTEAFSTIPSAYLHLGLTVPVVSNGVTCDFWLRDVKTTWRRKTAFVGVFATLIALQTAFNGADPIVNPDTTPETGLIAYVGTGGSPLTLYTYDGVNSAWFTPAPNATSTLQFNQLTLKNTSDPSISPLVAWLTNANPFTVTGILDLIASLSTGEKTTMRLAIDSPHTGDANTNYEATFQSKNQVVAAMDDLATALATTLNVTPTQAAALTAGQTYFISLIKSAIDGSVALDTSVRSINIFAPSSVNAPLLDPTGWGNVVGKGSEYKQITGDNTTGAFGNRGQICVLNGDMYVCLDHVTGTGAGDGSATWSRNRSLNFLDETMDAALITELTTESGWSSDQFKSTTNVSNKGRTYAGLTGYMYLCIDVNSWRRYQISIGGKPMQITTASSPNLTTNLAAHDFSTGNYIEVGGDEAAYQGQEYWVAGYIYRRGSMAQGWARIKTND